MVAVRRAGAEVSKGFWAKLAGHAHVPRADSNPEIGSLQFQSYGITSVVYAVLGRYSVQIISREIF